MRNTRTETDSLGEVAVPERALRLCAPQFQKFGWVGCDCIGPRFGLNVTIVKFVLHFAIERRAAMGLIPTRVALDSDLLKSFDRLIRSEGYNNRSEAFPGIPWLRREVWNYNRRRSLRAKACSTNTG